MEQRKMDRTIGPRRPVFGSTTMFGGRADLELPVSLVPTAMAGEKGSEWPAGSNASRGTAAGCASPVQSGETAELIGQEELPLRAALAAVEKAPDIPANIGDDDRGHESANPFDHSTAGPENVIAAEPKVAASVEDTDGGAVNARAAADARQPTEISTAAIEIRSVPGRGGRPAELELYPFGELSQVSVDECGELIGASFLIPDTDVPARHIAAARKRHRDKTFITRGEPGGTRIWRLK